MVPVLDSLLATTTGRRIVFLFLGSVFAVPQSLAGQSAKHNYTLHCMGCHLADGSGMPGKVPALKGQVGRFTQLPGGREFLVQVPGVAQSSLSDAELAAVLNWMLATLGSERQAAESIPYSAAEIAALRRIRLNDVAAARARILDHENSTDTSP